MAYEGLEDNKNAEKWSEDKALEFMDECYLKSKDTCEYIVYGKKITGNAYHFIGEVCAELEQYSDLPKYLKGKFDSCNKIYKKLKSRLEANCFSDSKKGIIKEASAIMNLKSNYGWTDRIDTTTKDKPIQQQILNIDPLSEYDKTDDSIKED
jgi:heme oxygenase